VEVPFELLAPDTLRRLIEEFVTRDGTDHGDVDHSLEERVLAVRRQLERGEAVIGFDPERESCSVTSRRSARTRA
jgi:uncharacterized protein